MNNFGFGGANTHVIFKQQQNLKFSTPLNSVSSKQHLFVHGARTRDGVENFLQSAVDNQNNLEYLNLLHKTADVNVSKYPFRGYTIVFLYLIYSGHAVKLFF